MSSWWWQKKLLPYGLRYLLSKTGILEEKAQDLADFNISVGKRNVIELKNVGLNIDQLSKFAKLPPCLRIESARVLSLRLTVPADFFQSSIVAEVEGLQLVVRFYDSDAPPNSRSGTRNERSSTSVRTPQHRKTDRRLRSPPPYDPGGLQDSHEDVRIPTTQEVVKSFLMDEPLQQRRELEASVAASSKSVEESFMSQSSEGDDVGTGVTVGVPSFLASFLQGLVDRLQVQIKDIQVKVETEVTFESFHDVPVTLSLGIGSVSVSQCDITGVGDPQSKVSTRTIEMREVSVDVLCEDVLLRDLSKTPSHTSQAETEDGRTASSTGDQLNRSTDHGIGDTEHPSLPLSPASAKSAYDPLRNQRDPTSDTSALNASISTLDADRFADAGEDEPAGLDPNDSESDIRLGDDNLSWGSRRSHATAPAEDLWKSMVSEDDLPESLILDQERISTPRAFPSRSTSPLVERPNVVLRPSALESHHAGSLSTASDVPSLRSKTPGSWSVADPDNFEINSSNIPDQHSSSYDDITTGGTRVSHDANIIVTDNKKAALEHPVASTDVSEADSSAGTMADDLAQSQIFDHEAAQSMYMSAMATDPAMHVPGGWDSQSQKSTMQTNPDLEPKQHLVEPDPFDYASKSGSGNVTPRPETPVHHQESVHRARPAHATCQSIYVDIVTVYIINAAVEAGPTVHEPTPISGMASSRAAHDIPGSFSAYSERSSSRVTESSIKFGKSIGGDNLPKEEPPRLDGHPSVEVNIGKVGIQLDVSTLRLLHVLGVKAKDAIQTSNPPKQSSHTSQAHTWYSSVILHNRALRLSLVDRIKSGLSMKTSSNFAHELVSLRCNDISLANGATTSLRLRSLALLLSGQDFLSVDDERGVVNESEGAHKTGSAISISIETNSVTTTLRPVINVDIQTSLIRLRLDPSIIDETFGGFGGLSGILELGGSMSAESGTSSPKLQAKASKGVRFASEPDAANLEPELKVNARLIGIAATLQGRQCSLILKTTTLKAVYREQKASATLDHVELLGPCQSPTQDAPIEVKLSAIRLDYVSTPSEKDLERLLSLLTPSKDKYDSDDDILVETLLRQRRKGALIRVGLKEVQLLVDNWECLSELSTLGEEVGKLSAVTKYLPEDDRPGLLTLLRAGDIDVKIPVNPQFGALHISSQNTNVAHVGLPALLAFSVETVRARRPKASELLHPLIPLSGADVPPMVMSRMLGDEEVPTVKVKLFNICLEYSVPILLALTGSSEGTNPQEILTDLSQSVANLTMSTRWEKDISRPSSDLSAPPSKKMTVDLLLHQSSIGLNPQKLPSKALLILSDVHASTVVPPEKALNARLDLRKVELLITDSIEVDPSDQTGRPSIQFTNSSDRLTAFLGCEGYVPVGSIRSAAITLHTHPGASEGSDNIEVDLQNELLLLETCADSTQTLITLLAALAPPSTPSRQPKYLTEPMTIEDMMASFTGEPLVQSEVQPETLFDVSEDQEDDPDILYDAETGEEETAELLAESEMTSSLYGPVSGVFGTDDDDDEDADIDTGETAESLLEDDPFEMPLSPTDVQLSDQALMRELRKQCKPAVDDAPVDLGLWEIEDLGFDALGGAQQVLGAKHRFSAPHAGTGKTRVLQDRQDVPFLLRLRDFHIIWHLYDGYDWERTRQGIATVVEEVERKAEERKARRRQSLNDRSEDESVIGDILFNSIYIGVPADNDAQELRRKINQNIDDQISETESMPLSGISRPSYYSGSVQPPRPRQRRRLKLGRSRTHKISFELKGVSADVVVYPPDTSNILNTVDLRIKDFEIFDNVPQSTWRKFLTHMESDPTKREMSKPMFHIHMETVKTIDTHSASEITLEVTVLPLRLHVDQDALDFITRFFGFKDKEAVASDTQGDQPFVQRLEVNTVDLCLDYKPKRIDYVGLRSGRTTEFMNIITLEAANIRLKHAIVYGLRGFDTIHPTLNDIWMPDVRRNQLPTVLAGLAPMRSLVNLGVGLRDVVAIPVREYRKDGRIVRSIQKGAFQFGKTTASELARLGAKVALGTQTVLSNAEEFLSPTAASPSARPSAMRRISSEQNWHDVASDDDEPTQRAVSAYANQPLGLLSGLRSARRHLEHDLLTARDALIAVQGELLESNTTGDAAAAVAKHAPTVILRPVIGATRAVGTTLLGVGNQVDRSNMRRIDDKYKRR